MWARCECGKEFDSHDGGSIVNGVTFCPACDEARLSVSVKLKDLKGKTARIGSEEFVIKSATKVKVRLGRNGGVSFLTPIFMDKLEKGQIQIF